MINKTFYAIFQRGSRTYFYSSLFFPMAVRREVFVLYGFVRKADNFVDSQPQNPVGFYKFRELYYQALTGKKTGDVVIDSFVELSRKRQFKEEWTEAFLHSMELDLKKTRYETLDETIEYMYGSAEVIGLFMSRLLQLKQHAYPYAQKLGRAMQYINFIRDIAEDLELNRVYFPQQDLREYELDSLDYTFTSKHPRQYTAFIEAQLQRYCQWQEEAEQGFRYISSRYLISVKTASEMYKWTAQQILNNPFVVYEWKVKPRIVQIVTSTLINLINIMGNKYETQPCPVKHGN